MSDGAIRARFTFTAQMKTRSVIAFFADDYCLGSGKNSNFVESMPRINGHVVVSASRDAPLDGKQSAGNSETDVKRPSGIRLDENQKVWIDGKDAPY